MATRRPGGRGPAGTQTLSRAIDLLKTIATGQRQGWRLSDLAGACSLDPATAHRILKHLVAERLVARDGDRRYLPGPMLFELGLSFPKPIGLIEATTPPLGTIAREFRAVGTLWLRSGTDVVCADRVGQTNTRVFVDVGTRRPLASMAPGLSILLEMKIAQRRALLAENLSRMKDLYPGRVSSFRKMIARSERAGYGISYGDVGPGIYSIGAAIAATDQPPLAAISLIGQTSDLAPGRVDKLAARLRATAEKIARDNADLLAGLG